MVSIYRIEGTQLRELKFCHRVFCSFICSSASGWPTECKTGIFMARAKLGSFDRYRCRTVTGTDVFITPSMCVFGCRYSFFLSFCLYENIHVYYFVEIIRSYLITNQAHCKMMKTPEWNHQSLCFNVLLHVHSNYARLHIFKNFIMKIYFNYCMEFLWWLGL